MNERPTRISFEKHCRVDLYFFTYIKKWYTLQKTGKKNNKLSDRPFTTIILKVTNPFNIETHHM